MYVHMYAAVFTPIHEQRPEEGMGVLLYLSALFPLKGSHYESELCWLPEISRKGPVSTKDPQC